jgi:hypothetical protein
VSMISCVVSLSCSISLFMSRRRPGILGYIYSVHMAFKSFTTSVYINVFYVLHTSTAEANPDALVRSQGARILF